MNSTQVSAKVLWILSAATLLVGCSTGGGKTNSGLSPASPVVGGPSSALGNAGRDSVGKSNSNPGPSGFVPSGATAGSSAVALSGSGGASPGSGKGSAGTPGTTATPATVGTMAIAGKGAAPTGAGAAGTSSPVSAPLTPSGPNCLQPGDGNYTSPGPYQVGKMSLDLGMIEAGQDAGTGGQFTIYYPNPLEKSCPHPIVAWGNGTGVSDSDFTYDFLNSNAASWGMVVAAAANSNTGSGAFHRAGLDWLLKQNMDSNSMFYQKLSTRAGLGGHSQGGIGANAAASHPNVVTMAIEGMTGVANNKVSVLVMTGTNDIVSGAEMLVTTATGPMFVVDWEGGNHVGTETVLGYLEHRSVRFPMTSFVFHHVHGLRPRPDPAKYV
jgi:hypothetical protein